MPSTRKKKSIQDVIPSALAALEKSVRKEPYARCPLGPLTLRSGRRLDLSQWSLIVTDECLKVVAANSDSAKMVVLNLSGAEKITDVGLSRLARCSSNLQSLVLDNAYRITGDGLAAITKHCHMLTNLSLSGCMGISGPGFGIIGQNCRELVHLSLAANRQITPFTFLKIFESCKRLQSLDISFCSMITDQELKVLANTASDLKQLNLRECKLISDVGLSFISQGNPRLSEINLRRSEMPFRITDVSLLQLGQACQSLVSINLHGCEMITDTGLSWLSGWSKKLRHIDLSNCSKVTNSGIRHLGEGCNELRSIVLLNLRRVSDVGVRCLAKCPHLEAVNGSGLTMLSDGVDRSFALEGLQALGAGRCSATMKHINFHGCSLLSTLSLKSIANFSNLETFNLSGCNKLTVTGAKCVGKTCRKILNLSLASCGDCITDALVESLVMHLKLLTTANLSFCTKLDERSLKVLSQCRHLNTLNLTGCTGITDQSILHLSEGSFSPGLRHLFLAQCCKVGDTSLSWLTEGLKQKPDGYVSLETLSLKGTRVSSAAVKGIRDRFQYSLLKSNASFHGFWPLSRISDRKEINIYHKRAHSAAIIQARVRARREKDTLLSVKREFYKKRVAILLGALFRGRKARILYKELKLAKKLLVMSSLRLQCALRCRIARKRSNRQREKKWLTIAPLSAKVIQKHWRGLLARRKVIKKREEKRQQCLRQIEASIQLQSAARMFLAKQLKMMLKRKFHAILELRGRASITIQCAWRIYVGVRTLKVLKKEFLEISKLQHASALRIKGTFKTILFRKAIQARVEQTRQRLESALRIQNWYRDQSRRQTKERIAKARLVVARLIASRVIQRKMRQRLAYLQLLLLRRRRDKLEALREENANILCGWGRVCVAKLRTQRRREEFEQEIKRALQLKIWASTKIAAGFRGKLGRERAKRESIIRAQRWKALWSEDDQCKFYYNQDTGETRWEKPQCLLDLEPKPICSNCLQSVDGNPIFADIECRECSEFFCTNCFQFIHNGGKRARHSYRMVYDYYGKRNDYDCEPWQTPCPKTSSASLSTPVGELSTAQQNPS